MSWLLARTALYEPWRSALGVGAVASALALVLVFDGFRSGLYAQARALPESWQVDLVAVQAGVENVLAARSVLPQRARRDIEAVPGVAAVHPLGGMPAIYADRGVSTPVYVIAYDTGGGPGALAAGHAIREPGEIVVDRALAARYRLQPGDRVQFLGYGFRVAGIDAGPTNAFNPYVYVRMGDLVDLYLSGALPEDVELEKTLGFLLIEVAPGASVDQVRAAVEDAVAAVDVWTPAQLAEADVRVMDDFMGSAMALLVTVARVAGILVVGLTIYGSVVARERDFAILRALGVRRAALGRQVAVESVAVGIAAFAVAIAVAWALAGAVEAAAPRYAVLPLETPVLLRTALAGGVMAVLGALGGIRRALLVDPMLVFRR
jgi:putative ABC transport system permease protein